MHFPYCSLSILSCRLSCASGIAIFLLLASPCLANASNLDIKSTISEIGSWDSNPLMLTHGATDLFGSSTRPTIIITDEAPTTQINSELSISENLYNQTSFNTTDFYGKARLARQAERWEVAMKGNAAYDTTRSSELTTLGLNVGSSRHTSYNVEPTVSYSLSPLNKLAVSGSYSESNYDSRSLNDYRVISANPSLTHNFSPLSQGILSFQAQRYQSLGRTNDRVDTTGFSLGLVNSLTPRLTTQISGGAQYSGQSSDNISNQDWQWSYVFSGNLSYKGEQDITTLSASRTRQPYVNGTESLLTTLYAQEAHKLTPLLSFNIKTSYQFADQPQSTGRNLESLWDMSTGLTYLITDSWDLNTSYQYRYEVLTGTDETAKQNVIRIGITFHPDAEG